MPEESRFYVARSYASGIFAIAVMLVLAAIVVVAFMYGASPGALRPVVIIGEPDIFPVDPGGDGFQAPDRPTDDSPMILVVEAVDLCYEDPGRDGECAPEDVLAVDVTE